MMVHGGNIWDVARQFGGEPDDYVDFSSNINPLGPPNAVWATGQAAFQQIQRYPEPQSESFCEAVGDYFNLPASCVVAGNGAAELIAAIPRLMPRNLTDGPIGEENGTSDGRVVVIQPTFAQYTQAARRAGRDIVELNTSPDVDFAVDPEAVLDAVEWGDTVFLCQPNNPTGGMIPHEDYLELIRAICDRGAFPVLDESFIGFVDGAVSGVDLLRKGYPVSIIYSLTKMYALPGLRLGAAMLPESMAKAVESQLVPWRVNVLAGEIGKVCLRQTDYVARTQKTMNDLRDDLVRRLNDMERIRPLPGAANFLLLHVQETGFSASEFTAKMAHHRVLVRDASNFPLLGHDYVRIAVRSADDNERLLHALNEVVRT